MGDAYLSQVVDDNSSQLTHMEVLDLVYHQCFFAANSLEHLSTTSQFFHPLTPQTVQLAFIAIHCVLSEYATGMESKIKLSQDEYRGTFCSTQMIHFTLGATALIIHNISRLLDTFPLSPLS